MDNELKENTETKTTEPKAEVDTAALEARIKQLESENGKLKQAQTNASADASEWKKKYQATLSDEAKKKEEQDAAYAAMQEKLATLEAERNIANYTAVLGSSDIGMDSETAKTVAEALNSGEVEKVFDALRKFINTHDKQLRENAFRTNPTLSGGNVPKVVSKEEFEKMGYTQRLEVFEKYPDLYKEYTS